MSTGARGNRWARVQIGVPFALFDEPDIGLSKKKLVIFGFRSEKLWFISFWALALAEIAEPVFRSEYHLLSLMNPILTFQNRESHLIDAVSKHLCLAVLVRPFRVYCIATGTSVTPTLYSSYLEQALLLDKSNLSSQLLLAVIGTLILGLPYLRSEQLYLLWRFAFFILLGSSLSSNLKR